MALNDIYQLIVNQTLQGKDIQNVFFFNKADPAGTASDLFDGFMSDYAPTLKSIQSAQLHWVSVDILNLGDLSDFGSFPAVGVGLAGDGDTMPAFNAIGYTLKTVTRAIRPGSKRFAGVLEALVTNGVAVEPTFVAEIEAVRVKLDDQVTGVLADYDPVIVKRVKVPVVGSVPPKFTYRLPTIGETPVVGLIKQAFSNLTVTSQVSRKD